MNELMLELVVPELRILNSPIGYNSVSLVKRSLSESDLYVTDCCDPVEVGTSHNN